MISSLQKSLSKGHLGTKKKNLEIAFKDIIDSLLLREIPSYIYIAPKMMFPTNLLQREIHKDIMQYETNYREYEEFYQELMELNG